MPRGLANPAIRFIRGMAGAEDDHSLADREILVRIVSERNEEAFALLVRRYGSMVLGVCLRVLPNKEDAEDAFQATFLALARSASSLRPRESVGGWLHTVAYRDWKDRRVAPATFDVTVETPKKNAKP